jgi:hypothetical protein
VASQVQLGSKGGHHVEGGAAPTPPAASATPPCLHSARDVGFFAVAWAFIRERVMLHTAVTAPLCSIRKDSNVANIS